jgi:hypothetical protein
MSAGIADARARAGLLKSKFNFGESAPIGVPKLQRMKIPIFVHKPPRYAGDIKYGTLGEALRLRHSF